MTDHDGREAPDSPAAPVTAGGWTFDPAREVWQAKTGTATWTEVKGALDNPPLFSPQEGT